MTLLTDSELAAIQAYGIEGMRAMVSIYPMVYDTGTDLTDDPYGSSTTFATTPSAVVGGWLVGRWDDNRTPDVGEVNVTTTYRLRLPVGTVLASGWRIVVNSNNYLVIYVGDDQTWPEWLTCIVKRTQ